MRLTPEQQWAMQRIADAPTAFVIGIDEVGRGAVAGPLVVCGAVFDKTWRDERVKDSKAYSSHKARAKAYTEAIAPVCRHRHIDVVPHKDVDAIGIERAVSDAMHRCAIECIVKHPGAVLVVDGDYFPLVGWCSDIMALPKGDTFVPAVSAASVIAKTARDSMMTASADIYPGYGFEQHKGYYTEAHRDALWKLGPSPIHRHSCQPVAAAAQFHNK